MDNTLMLGLSRQLVLRRAVDVTANNIANMNTTGFKLDSPSMTENRTRERDAFHQDGPRGIAFVENADLLRDFSAGPIQTTGRSLDVALEGEGFFALRDGEDIRYSRDGRFTLDPDGRLVTQSGLLVLDDQQAEITLPQGGRVDITADGAVSVDDQPVAQLGVVRFDNRSALSKTGDGLFVAEDVQPQPDDAPRVRQGALEGSNVNGIREITRLIEIQRSYESVSRMISNVEDLRKRAVERLGRAA